MTKKSFIFEGFFCVKKCEKTYKLKATNHEKPLEKALKKLKQKKKCISFTCVKIL